jgi:hypothetical protein
VRAAAELAGVVADLDDPHGVAVLLAEQGQRADRRASSCVVTNARTSRSASAISLISCSTSASTDGGTAPGEEKSKRNRPGR